MVKSLENLDKSFINQDRIYGLNDALDTKQPNLVSGENIKSINDSSILGEGNLNLANIDLNNLSVEGRNNINPLYNVNVTNLTYASDISLETNKVYTLTISGDVTFSLPTPTENVLNQILVQGYLTGAYAINFGTSSYFGEDEPDTSDASFIDILWEYDWLCNKWIVGFIKKVIV